MTTVIQGKPPSGKYPKFIFVVRNSGASANIFLSSDQRNHASFGGYAISSNAAKPTGYSTVGSGVVS
jgi:hypothetical protein